ncbi:MAG TPA: ferritin [Ruminococcaceae bacterium]|nr:ferritin [Oscillospiraceae bacterium]
MLGSEIKKLLEDQVKHEFHSAYIYLGMHTYYAGKNLNGFANWFDVQVKEECDHGRLMLQYLLNNGEVAEFSAIDAITSDYDSFRAPLEEAYKHEVLITEKINRIYEAAYSAKDFRTLRFLDWFIQEQGEEEKNVDDLIKRYDLFGKDSQGLYQLDTELAARVYTAPSLVL